MPNIKGDIVQVEESVVYREANVNFNAMVKALKEDKGVSMTIDQGYLSVYELVDELRGLVKNKNPESTDNSDAQTNTNVSSLLDPNKSIETIVGEGTFELLKSYVDNLDYAEFEPTLIQSFEGGLPPTYPTTVYPYPNKTNQDPRRTGRFVVPKPQDVFKQVEVQKWLINNGLKYGFVLYGDDGLYYISYQVAIDKIKTSPNKEETLQRLLRRC